MESTESPLRDLSRDATREVAMPTVSLLTLRRELAREAGPLAAIHALQAAGYGAGEALWENLRRAPAREPLTELDAATFWERLGATFDRRGWGVLTHRSAHPGVGLLTSGDWAEAGGSEDQPSCSFSTGLLSGFLSGAAGGPIAVLEVSCRSQGDEACTFAFGSAAAVHDLYGLLLEGQSLDSALASL